MPNKLPTNYKVVDIIAALQSITDGRRIKDVLGKQTTKTIFLLAIKELKKSEKLRAKFKKAAKASIKRIPKYELMPAQAQERKTTIRECLQAIDEMDV